MMKRLLIAAALVTATAGVDAASAMPMTDLGAAANANVVQVYGGCGPYRHRGPYGGCRAGGQLGGYGRGRPCPPGFHLGPAGARCRPNF